MITDLKIKRILAGLKQVEVAKLAPIDRQRLCMAENGWITLKPEEVRKIRAVIDAKSK